MEDAEYTLVDPFVRNTLDSIDDVAEEVGVEYTVVGGLAVHSYVMEGVAAKHGKPVDGMKKRMIEQFLRGTDDIDMAFLTDSEAGIPEFKGALFNPARSGYGGELTAKQPGRYEGRIERQSRDAKNRVGREQILLNANENEETGFPADIYREIVETADRYEAQNCSFNRIGLEELVWSKITASLADGSRAEKDMTDLAYLFQYQGDNMDNGRMQYLIDRTERQDPEEVQAMYDRFRESYEEGDGLVTDIVGDTFPYPGQKAAEPSGAL